jgi:hypothetical protein
MIDAGRRAEARPGRLPIAFASDSACADARGEIVSHRRRGRLATNVREERRTP